MSGLSQRHQRTALPFEYAKEGLELDVDRCRLDGDRVIDVDLGPGEWSVDLTPTGTDSEGGAPWDRAVVSLDIELPEAVVERVFPEDERDEPPAQLYVAVRCRQTIYRSRASISQAPTAAGCYELDVELDWKELRGLVELRPYLVRTRQRELGGRYGGNEHVRLADGPTLTVLLDDEERSEHTYIDGEEASFSQASNLPDGSKLYYLDFRDEARPKLWINADNPRIADILQTEGSVGAGPRMRDVILDQIGYGVWSQLILRAASAVDAQGSVPHDWQESVMTAFGKHLYEVEDEAEVARRLRRELQTAGRVAYLMERVDLQLQEFLDTRAQIVNLMEEGLRL